MRDSSKFILQWIIPKIINIPAKESPTQKNCTDYEILGFSVDFTMYVLHQDFT